MNDSIVQARNILIEAWMSTKGYFPGVFTEDRYGNVQLINTQTNKKAGTK